MSEQTAPKKVAIIIGAGPAGLTAAYELLKTTTIKPIIYESSNYMGGISKTINYKGNRMDMGGHRFFSKSDHIMKWWQEILPLENTQLDTTNTIELTYQNKKISLPVSDFSTSVSDASKTDQIMLIRNRLSRIFFLNTFFDYPLTLSLRTITNLGFIRIIKIMLSYIKARILPIKKELSLEDFFINRFGKELYLTFFKDYTEKIWGISCTKIEPEWGAQRIKGLSISKTLTDVFKRHFNRNTSINQRNTETSLIQKFLYPKYGPGQMWEEVAKKIIALGGEIHTNKEVSGLDIKNNLITSIKITNGDSTEKISGDYFISTMPIKQLISSFNPRAPKEIKTISDGLIYRDFITVGLLMKKLKIKNKTKVHTTHGSIPDNWIYIQDNHVKIGRLQIFNNWSPYMVNNPENIWIGLEYFCNEGDSLWNKSDTEFIRFAIDELAKINIIEKEEVLDQTIARVPKAYPAYFGTYTQLNKVRGFTDSIANLFLVGRNGMHKYNNQDHSMITAMTAVENIKNDIITKDNIWKINTEQEYHETK